MRILLTGGGTGGHTFPLVAVLRKLKELDANVRVLFIGPDKASGDILKSEDIEVKSIFSPKFRRYFSLFNVIDIFKLPIALAQAYWQIFWFMPDVVFSKGGYGSVPVIIISWIFRVPIVLHESDYVPGLSNRALSMLAKKIFVSFRETQKTLNGGKVSVVGNPVRAELFSGAPDVAKEKLSLKTQKPVILVLGGSQGSQQINDLMLLSVPDLIKQYEIIHQCGKKNFESFKEAMIFQLKDLSNKNQYHLYSDLAEEELKNAFAVSDIVVSRAGSGAIFEIAAAGKPGILIPYKPASGSHQEKNAHAYAKTGAAIVLEGDNLTPHLLQASIDSIIKDQRKWARMSNAAKAFAKPDAAEKVALELISLAL